MNNQLMEIPKCPAHGESLILRVGRQSKESQFCGTWYDCPVCRCGYSVLYPSKELRAQLARQRG